MESYTRTYDYPNLFANRTKKRNKVQMMHDILVSAKDGAKKTRITHALQIEYRNSERLLKSAKRAGLIEEVEATGEMKYYTGKPTMIWKTTDKGLEWARRVWEDHDLVMGDEI